VFTRCRSMECEWNVSSEHHSEYLMKGIKLTVQYNTWLSKDGTTFTRTFSKYLCKRLYYSSSSRFYPLKNDKPDLD
jgi:hypothetical protein